MSPRVSVDPKTSSTEDVVYPDVTLSQRADVFTSHSTDDPMRNTVMDEGPMRLTHRKYDDPILSRLDTDDPIGTTQRGVAAESDDENTFVEVEQTRKAKRVKKKARVKVRPDSPGSSLSDEKCLKRLRKKCGISEEILLLAPTPADRADALRIHDSINPRGIRHLLGIYVLSRECGIVISTEHLSYLTDFRVRGRSEELKHTVTKSSGMALIAGFPSKDDHFEDLKPSLSEVSEEFVAATHIELSSGNGNWRKSFSRRRIERALSAEILPGKILGRGLARMSFREQVALEVAAKTKRSSGSSASRVVAPMTSSPTDPSVRVRLSRPSASKTLLPPPSSGKVAEFCRLSAERARISSGKGKGVHRETPSKRQRDFSVPCRDSEFGAAKEANGVLQSRLDETVEWNEALERDALVLQKVKKDYDDNLAKLKLRCTKVEGEVVQLRGELSSASDLQRSRINDAIAEARDEMARSFTERTSEGSDPPDLPTEVKELRGRRHPIYDAHGVFADLLASVQRVLDIPVVSAGTAEASVAVDDDVEVSDKDDVEVTDDDEDAED
ncbi:hypothetical protein AALP_AA6G219000 [Arabis alpina]|uniref:Uncharacterized protein n=1 Tax=Arabis alpina TaxID=50452 RepID=A0A087GQV7_ARAAL|nr:hypothetical protein AALP_AA6G219000 [Arabis alpina]